MAPGCAIFTCIQTCVQITRGDCAFSNKRRWNFHFFRLHIQALQLSHPRYSHLSRLVTTSGSVFLQACAASIGRLVPMVGAPLLRMLFSLISSDGQIYIRRNVSIVEVRRTLLNPSIPGYPARQNRATPHEPIHSKQVSVFLHSHLNTQFIRHSNSAWATPLVQLLQPVALDSPLTIVNAILPIDEAFDALVLYSRSIRGFIGQLSISRPSSLLEGFNE